MALVISSDLFLGLNQVKSVFFIMMYEIEWNLSGLVMPIEPEPRVSR